MGRNLVVIVLAFVAMTLTSASRCTAGTDMIIDNSAQAPPPAYNYAPPPPVVYYVPPPRVVVYTPPPRVRVFAYHRPYVRRSHCNTPWR